MNWLNPYLIAGVVVFSLLVWLGKRIDWSVVANRALHWMACMGTFLLCDAVGIPQRIADWVELIGKV